MEQVIDVGCVKEEQCEVMCNMIRAQDWQLAMRHRDLGLVKIEQEMNIAWPGTNNATEEIKELNLEKIKKYNNNVKSQFTVAAINKPFKCLHCVKDFATSSNLKVHLTRTHSGDQERPFVCPNCPKSFATNDNLQKHIRRHSNERTLHCPHCPKAFATKDNLQKHIRRHSNERTLVCPHCPKAFATNDNLQKHIRRHSSERTLQCPHCPKAFATNDNLHRHIRGHTGVRPFKCPYCPKPFAQNRDLKAHILEHIGEKPFKCPHCPKACVRNEGLKKHILRLHKDVEPEHSVVNGFPKHCWQATKEATYINDSSGRILMCKYDLLKHSTLMPTDEA
ncbi:zinc finger protein 431-like [Drosophila sulfurigaster albostrigata]|uniref:zinc finger protein 431-like n=1 Tax=Drosophila sulfurigaster albostrigata TaxID=89887 RepID=UPI002D21A55F|nr:zinc finger protein 431-like [Drosophila sulfurigaster albostrigata]